MARKREAVVDATTILAGLENGPATAKELDTTSTEMKALAAAGVVVDTGETRRTGKRGKPPTLWAKADGATIERAAEIAAEPAPTKREPSQNFSSRITTALGVIQNGTNTYENCECVMVAESIEPDELKHMPGCKDRWVCGALVKLRIMV